MQTSPEQHLSIVIHHKLIPLPTLGQSGTVGVILRKNDPVNVVCGEEPQTYGQDKCSQLLLSLPADVQPPRVFGAYWVRAAGQHVDELIPTYYPSCTYLSPLFTFLSKHKHRDIPSVAFPARHGVRQCISYYHENDVLILFVPSAPNSMSSPHLANG